MSQSQQMHTAMMPPPVQPSPTATDMGKTRTKKKPRNVNKGAVAVSMSTTQMGSAAENTNMMVVEKKTDSNALMIFLLIACTLAWFFGLHIWTNLESDSKGQPMFLPTTIKMENCLDFRCFLVTVLITLGALSLQPNILPQKCAMIPFYAFPPFVLYFLLEAATVIWKVAVSWPNFDSPPNRKLEGHPVARYLLDAICCLVITACLVYLHLVARRKSPEWEQQESTQQYQQQATHGYAPYNIPSSPSMMPMPPPPPPPPRNPSEEQQQNNQETAGLYMNMTQLSQRQQAMPGPPVTRGPSFELPSIPDDYKTTKTSIPPKQP